MSTFDLTVTGGQAVLPGGPPVRADLGIRGGRIIAIADDLTNARTTDRIDATGQLVVPGAIDAHFHLGVYRGIAEDALTETRSAARGGVTSILSYFRTGGNYLGRSGPYRDLLPEIFAEVDGRAHVDYGFHLAPMTRSHLDEVDWLVGNAGITSFKYYLYYKGLNLIGSSTKGSEYSMTEDYDLGHLFDLMERITATDAATRPDQRVSLSLHCESAELIRLFLERYACSDLPPLERYSRSRPPVSERLSVHEVGVLADETHARINLLHLSSAQAIRACRELRQLYPTMDVRLETTAHHLTLTHDECEFLGARGKVNPPLREDADRDALWRAVRDGTIDWVASDHACCLEEQKLDIDTAVPGYGGTALLWPALLTEGRRRQVPIERLVDLLTGGPARAFGCYPTKGALSIGADADIAVLDLATEREVTTDLLASAQDYSPFLGRSFTGWPSTTILRGQVIYADDQVQGAPTGRFLHRPLVVCEPGHVGG